MEQAVQCDVAHFGVKQSGQQGSMADNRSADTGANREVDADIHIMQGSVMGFRDGCSANISHQTRRNIDARG